MKEPIWITVARSYIGTEEVKGVNSNSKIMKMAYRLGGWIKSFYTSDEIPWCALFVNNVLKQVKLKGTNSLAARSFEHWGLNLTSPRLGAVLVFARKGGGHVGFYIGETSTKFRVLGGNQSDTVNEMWLDKIRLVAIRWPLEVPLHPWGPVALNDDGKAVSTNEA